VGGLDCREWSTCLGLHSFVLARGWLCSRSRSSSRGTTLALQLLVLLPQSVDSINHLLNQFNLRIAQPVLVGDVIGMTSLSTRLTTGATGLQVKLFTSCFQLVNRVVGPARKINMDRSSHTSAKVGGARVNVTILFVQAEVLARFLLDRFLHSLDTISQPLEDSLDITALLHGDDAKLIFLINPGQESLLLVVEDSTALRPVPLHSSNNKVSVSRHKQEMIINQLLPNILLHASEGVVGTSQFTLKVGKGFLHQAFNPNTLFFRDSGRQTKSINGATNTDSAGVNWNIGVNIALDLAGIHVRGVCC